jgi:branched-chain amino acid transport system substrate-binding protein
LAYHRKYNDHPRLGSVVGYSMIHALAAGITKAKSTETEKLVTAFSGLSFSTPFGKATFRKQDNQSTMGAFLGRTKNDNGKGVLVDYRYIDGATVQPSDDVVKKLRPSN